MELSYAIAERLKELLREKQMTQYRLFRNCGVPQSTISTILHAKCKTAKLATLCALCRGLDTQLRQFFHSKHFVFKNEANLLK